MSVLAVATAALGAAQSRTTDPSKATLVVAGDVAHPLTLTPADLKSSPRTTVTVRANDRDLTYEGVLVGELLTRAGAPVGPELSGNALATYVLASAKDGYQVVFSLAELDPGIAPNDVIVADTIDGQPLPDDQGPWRVVASHDKRGARSVRMLQRLEVVRLRK